MALRTGKRKQPTREQKQTHYALKITDKVLDDQTLKTLAELLNAGGLRSLDYPVSAGKEAVVFRATRKDGTFVAVKVFKFETTAFRKMIPYIEGDPRFEVGAAKHSKRALVKVWTRKEYANLRAAFNAKVSVPQPYAFKENIIVMQFIGENGVPCALLTQVEVQDPDGVFKKLLEDVRRLYAAGIVHSDLSPYNIILLQHQGESGKYEETPFLIDFAQGVSLRHPRAGAFLEHDVASIVSFFRKAGVKSPLCDEAKALEFVLKG